MNLWGGKGVRDSGPIRYRIQASVLFLSYMLPGPADVNVNWKN